MRTWIAIIAKKANSIEIAFRGRAEPVETVSETDITGL